MQANANANKRGTVLQKTIWVMGLAASFAGASAGVHAATAEVATPSGTVRFEMPSGYRELSAEEIAAKFGRHGRTPIKAYGNKTLSSTVAVTWSKMQKQALTQEALPQLKSMMMDMLPKLTPGLEFQETGVVTIGQRSWVMLRSTAPAVDASIHNHMYLTDLGGHMVGVNYNATAKDYAGQRNGFEASAKTLGAEQ